MAMTKKHEFCVEGKYKLPQLLVRYRKSLYKNMNRK